MAATQIETGYSTGYLVKGNSIAARQLESVDTRQDIWVTGRKLETVNIRPVRWLAESYQTTAACHLNVWIDNRPVCLLNGIALLLKTT